MSTNLQSFGLIVTAEPYYAVTMPSDLVVAQNVAPTGKIHGQVEEVNAHYSQGMGKTIPLRTIRRVQDERRTGGGTGGEWRRHRCS